MRVREHFGCKVEVLPDDLLRYPQPFLQLARRKARESLVNPSHPSREWNHAELAFDALLTTPLAPLLCEGSRDGLRHKAQFVVVLFPARWR